MNGPVGVTASRGATAARRWGLLAIFVAICALVLPNLRVSWREPNGRAEAGGRLGVLPGPVQPLSESETYARAAQLAGPAVVNIDTQQNVSPDVMGGDWFTDAQPQVQTSEGSGIIISASGDILTNEHVVGAANEAGKKILVTLNDGTGRKLPGVVIGADHQTDVALVHIDAPNLPVAKMGTVKGLVPGQMAVAIGNPLGFRFTVTHGVVSALGRPINDDQEGRVYENLIQTDCAINPGNSGGALLNIEGQVIGINTIVATRAQGIGFAIPIDTALRVAEELKRFGRVKRPWLGLVVITNTAQLATYYGLPNTPGVVAAKIPRTGPAAGAGLRRGDVITRVNGSPVRSEEEFKSLERKLAIGQSVPIELQRGDQGGKGTIVVGEAQ